MLAVAPRPIMFVIVMALQILELLQYYFCIADEDCRLLHWKIAHSFQAEPALMDDHSLYILTVHHLSPLTFFE